MTRFNSLPSLMTRSRVIKVVVVGNSGAGKTSCLRRFIDNTFSPRHRASIGITVYEKKASKILKRHGSLNEDFVIQFWDMNSQQYYAYIRREFYFRCSGVIFVADVTDEQSITDLHYWLQEVNERTDPISGTPLSILLLNKIDLLKDKTINDSHLAAIPKELRSTVFASSAKDDIGITEGITSLVFLIIKARQEKKEIRDAINGLHPKNQVTI